MANKAEQQTQKQWYLIVVNKTRIIKELENAILIKMDFDRSTILPKVFKRMKETKDFIYFSLPEDFNANVRVSVRNEKTRRYEHRDYSVSVKDLKEGGLDKPIKENEDDVPANELEKAEEEFVGENATPAEDDLPF